jgi:hypothetical protein
LIGAEVSREETLVMILLVIKMSYSSGILSSLQEAQVKDSAMPYALTLIKSGLPTSFPPQDILSPSLYCNYQVLPNLNWIRTCCFAPQFGHTTCVIIILNELILLKGSVWKVYGIHEICKLFVSGANWVR